MNKIQKCIIGITIGIFVNLFFNVFVWNFDYGCGWLLHEGINSHSRYISQTGLTISICIYPILGLITGFFLSKYKISYVGFAPFLFILIPISTCFISIIALKFNKIEMCGTERSVAENEVFAFLCIIGFISILLFSGLFLATNKLLHYVKR